MAWMRIGVDSYGCSWIRSGLRERHLGWWGGGDGDSDIVSFWIMTSEENFCKLWDWSYLILLSDSLWLSHNVTKYPHHCNLPLFTLPFPYRPYRLTLCMFYIPLVSFNCNETSAFAKKKCKENTKQNKHSFQHKFWPAPCLTVHTLYFNRIRITWLPLSSCERKAWLSLERNSLLNSPSQIAWRW